jgi:hypothetical protein
MKLLLCFASVSILAVAQSFVSVSEKTFEFHSGFWIKLDHSLREQVSVLPPPAPVAPVWTEALEYYLKSFIEHTLPSSEAVMLNNQISAIENAAALRRSTLDPVGYHSRKNCKPVSGQVVEDARPGEPCLDPKCLAAPLQVQRCSQR